jgi:membrane protein insertase Oxa1/YidC/SpoIIIJ
MAETTKIVKGGFRASIALIISIIALALSILAYTSSGKEEQLNARIKDLQGTIEKIKAESSDQLNKMRNETAKALEKMSQAVKQDEGAKEGAGVKTQEPGK